MKKEKVKTSMILFFVKKEPIFQVNYKYNKYIHKNKYNFIINNSC